MLLCHGMSRHIRTRGNSRGRLSPLHDSILHMGVDSDLDSKRTRSRTRQNGVYTQALQGNLLQDNLVQNDLLRHNLLRDRRPWDNLLWL